MPKYIPIHQLSAALVSEIKFFFKFQLFKNQADIYNLMIDDVCE